MIQAAIYLESFNPILMIVLKKNVAKKVDFLIGMSEKVATRSRMQRLNKPRKDDILRGFFHLNSLADFGLRRNI